MNNSMINQSVSTATMRPEDLLPRFKDALVELRAENNILSHGLVERRMEKIIERFNNSADLTMEQEDELSLDADDVLDQAFNELNRFAPEGFYFGSHPGDGADYGFWKNEDEEDEA